MNIQIRQEKNGDRKAVFAVVKNAFKNAEYADGDEQELVVRLRKSTSFIPELSLVALFQEKIIGHILFTKLPIGNHLSLSLAPVSVLPKYQRQGIGGQLINEGHRLARQLGYTSIIVLGHAKYYPRFGYVPASQWGIKAPFEVPDEAFMAVELVDGSLNGIHGTVEYPKEFFEANLTASPNKNK